MGFEWDEAERQAFDSALVAHLAAQFPDATFSWGENNRRLFVAFPEGVTCSIWEPNFFFSYPSFTQEHLFKQAADHIAGARAQLADKVTSAED